MENKLKELRLDAKELSEMLERVTRPKVKDFLTLDLRKIETEIIKIEDTLKSSSNNNPSSSSSKAHIVSNATGKSYDVLIKNYSWEESDNYVKIYIMDLKNVQSLTQPGDVVCEFTNNSVYLKLNNLNGKNLIFSVKETADEFNADKSYHKLKTDMVILFLKKNSSEKWEKLTKSEKMAAEAKADKFKPSKKNDDDPQASIMELMKNMYEQGDDEMKRTIVKSFSEGMKNQ